MIRRNVDAENLTLLLRDGSNLRVLLEWEMLGNIDDKTRTLL